MQKKRLLLLAHQISVYVLGFFMVAFIFAGCGPGADSSPPPVLTGSFKDSSVSGLNYRTVSLSGITAADGTFQYRAGETVTFSVGEILLGSTTGKPIVTPVDLVRGAKSSANLKSVNICRFLQTLDIDFNHANGIEITPEIRALLTWDSAWGPNDTSIFDDYNSIFVSTGTVPFTNFMTSIRARLNNAGVFTVSSPRTLRSATASRRNLNTTLLAIAPHSFAPFVKEVGIGVTDLNISMQFYEKVLGMKYVSYLGRADRVEVMFEDDRPSETNRVVLMHFNDKTRNCKDHPFKLVFAVSNAQAVYEAIIGGGGKPYSPPVNQPGLGIVGMGLDPDGYLIELVQSATVPGKPRLVGVGIGVASLQDIDDFYVRVLGMRFDYYLHVAGFMNEVILISPHTPTKKGIDVVLMNYFSPKVYANVPAKMVFTVADPASVIKAIADEGLAVIQPPGAGIKGIAKDPSGYEIEFKAD